MAEPTKHRSTTQAALIGSVAGVAGGIANATLTHPFDTHMTLKQLKKPPNFSLFMAPFHKEMWEGVGSSAFKKGLGFGIGLGTTFAVESVLKKAISDRQLKKLGFHKAQ